MTLLEITDLSVKYHCSNQWALEGVNFSVEKEELIVVAGPSGCGKSTLAQTILGLIPAFIEAEILGKIKIKEKILSELSRKDIISLLGYIPQYPADFTTSLLAEEEIAFSLENRTFPRQEIMGRIRYVLEQLEISHLRHRLITELSSGEIQRVALATALAPKPPILILDEPMARIDPEGEIKLAHILQKLTQQGHLVIAFEHRLDYLLPLADRLLLLDNGILIADGEPRSLLDEIKDVDLPEVSELIFPDKSMRALDLDEAEVILSKKISEM